MNNQKNSSFLFDRFIVLIGMMGSGKSSIGRSLANRLHLPFYDSDEMIEDQEKLTIAELFEKKGEPYFRKVEEETIRKIFTMPQGVLSIGGGAFMNGRTRELVFNQAFSIWLKADIEVLLDRISGTTKRPLLQGDDPTTRLRSLLASREAIYALADLVVVSERQPIEAMAGKVEDAFKEFLSKQVVAH